MRIAQEEIFGPVAALIPFKDENDAVLQGNDTVYGLAAWIWTHGGPPGSSTASAPTVRTHPELRGRSAPLGVAISPSHAFSPQGYNAWWCGYSGRRNGPAVLERR